MEKYKRGGVLAFKYAILGLITALKQEPNLKFHLLAGLLVIFSGIYLQISNTDWVAIILLIGLVISLELTNTAIEVIVDSFTLKEHPAAKMAKDISAGAVLIASITALTAGLIIIIPYLK